MDEDPPKRREAKEHPAKETDQRRHRRRRRDEHRRDDRRDDKGKADDDGGRSRTPRTGGHHDRPPDDVQQCAVCLQTVGGGEVGMAAHVANSKYHLAAYYWSHGRGMQWEQALARANKEEPPEPPRAAQSTPHLALQPNL